MKKRHVLAAAALLCALCAFFLTKTPELEDAPASAPAALDGLLDGPVPYPPPRLTSTDIPKTYPLDKIIAYKALPAYSQPAWMDSLVQCGALPPVEKRVPDEPCVLLASGMSDGLGEYGDAFRGTTAAPIEGWNWGAGQSQGYFGINDLFQIPLVCSGPTFMRSDTLLPLPNLAKSWEWSADGRSLVMHIIKGAKWSDGHPFTTDDVMFTWNDIILDESVRSITSRTSWQINGKNISLKALDAYTLLWSFPEPFPYYLLFQMDDYDFCPSPAHILKQHHPRYNPKADYLSFENCLPPSSLPAVTMGPWVPVSCKTDEILVLRRNPYYWKVDESGKQLPYLNEVVYLSANEGTKRTINLLSGTGDLANVEEPSEFATVLKAQKQPNAPFSLRWGVETLGIALILNQSLSLGVKNERDRAIRELLRDLRFRRALCQGIDREGLCISLTRGGFVRPWAGGLYPGSPEFDAASVVYYPYSPRTACALLAQLGFKDTDGNGYVNWTSGPLKGEDLVISLAATSNQVTSMSLAEALIPLLSAIGIKINYRVVMSTIFQKMHETGEWELRIYRPEQYYAVPIAYARELAPIRREAPIWHREGKEPRVLQDFERELVALINSYVNEADARKRAGIMKDYNRIFTANLYDIGLTVGSYGLGLARRFRNIPAGTPAFLYQWSEANIRSDQLWVRPDEQLPEVSPNTVPLFKK